MVLQNKFTEQTFLEKMGEFYMDNLPTETWEEVDRPFRRAQTSNFTFRLSVFRSWCFRQSPQIILTTGEMKALFALCNITCFRRRFQNQGNPLVLWEAPL